jgi:hypothetical protein
MIFAMLKKSVRGFFSYVNRKARFPISFIFNDFDSH